MPARHALVLALASAALAPSPVGAEGNCTTLDLQFTPAAQADNPFAPQVVAWIERPDGTYVDTIFITAQTGSFGIGNRPGRFDFNSGPAWPYGRRVTVFPVWAHRHGLSWDELVFQDGLDSNLSHPFADSSRELHFCRPLKPSEPAFDAMTCASQPFTDKGTPGPNKSLYPPRNDLIRESPDDPAVDTYDMLNPFDAVSAATPPPGALATITWPVPEALPFGDYVLWVEVSRELDANDTYNATTYPGPTNIAFADYGVPYRGQPSIVYQMPFAIEADGDTVATATDYVGYGDPDGLDGELRAPDATITSDVPGSGASRLQLVSDGGAMFRLRLTARPQVDLEPPAEPRQLGLVSATSTSATLAFTAPGDDGAAGRATRYEIRYVAGTELTAATFDAAPPIATVVSPADGGTSQQFTIDGLLPETDYAVGIRAIDDCRNTSALVFASFSTEARAVGEVDACFVATAAYGSVMANDVHLLRRVRDAVLRRTALGELAVETYYTFGPALAGVIGESDLLRASARGVLAPIVDRVRDVRIDERSESPGGGGPAGSAGGAGARPRGIAAGAR